MELRKIAAGCAVAIWLTGVAAGASAQPALRAGGACTLEFFPRDPANPPATNALRPPGSENYNIYVGGGALYRCQGQDVALSADSTEYIEAAGILYLIGNVRYREPRVRVDATRMTYFQAEDRLLAEGSVQAETPSGTRMRGPRVEYFRAVPGRPRQRMLATGRPHTTVVQRDSSGRTQEPVEIVSDRVLAEGDSLVYAAGRVNITRTDIIATADSALLDSGREYARLMRAPSIESRPRRPGDRTFRLTGTTIDLFSRQRQLQRVLALGEGKAASSDLTLTADTIDMRVQQGGMERAYAWGASRAHVVSPDRDIVADSLDVWMPGQRLREVRALRDAVAETDADTTRIRSGERDWIGGDTVIARFDTIPPPPRSAGDTASRQPPVREVVATGEARSFYQVASAVGGPTRPAINYVRGRQITLRFAQRAAAAVAAPGGTADGALPTLGSPAASGGTASHAQQLETVTVVDSSSGVFLEPSSDTTRRPAASAAPTNGRPSPTASPRTPSATQPTTRTPTPRTPTVRPPSIPVRRPDE